MSSNRQSFSFLCVWVCFKSGLDPGGRSALPDNWLTVLQQCGFSPISIYKAKSEGFLSPILHICSGFMCLFHVSIPDRLPDRYHCWEPAGMTACPWRRERCHRWLSYVDSQEAWWHSLIHTDEHGSSHRPGVIRVIPLESSFHNPWKHNKHFICLFLI